jgi:hypothetical protein
MIPPSALNAHEFLLSKIHRGVEEKSVCVYWRWGSEAPWLARNADTERAGGEGQEAHYAPEAQYAP